MNSQKLCWRDLLPQSSSFWFFFLKPIVGWKLLLGKFQFVNFYTDAYKFSQFVNGIISTMNNIQTINTNSYHFLRNRFFTSTYREEWFMNMVWYQISSQGHFWAVELWVTYTFHILIYYFKLVLISGLCIIKC